MISLFAIDEQPFFFVSVLDVLSIPEKSLLDTDVEDGHEINKSKLILSISLLNLNISIIIESEIMKSGKNLDPVKLQRDRFGKSSHVMGRVMQLCHAMR